MKAETFPTVETPGLGQHGTLPIHSAEELTDGCRKAIITLNSQHYTLHITKQGKLLLTK